MGWWQSLRKNGGGWRVPEELVRDRCEQKNLTEWESGQIYWVNRKTTVVAWGWDQRNSSNETKWSRVSKGMRVPGSSQNPWNWIRDISVLSSMVRKQQWPTAKRLCISWPVNLHKKGLSLVMLLIKWKTEEFERKECKRKPEKYYENFMAYSESTDLIICIFDKVLFIIS